MQHKDILISEMYHTATPNGESMYLSGGCIIRGKGIRQRISTMTYAEATQQFYLYSLHIRGYSPKTILRYKYVLSTYYRYTKVNTVAEITTDSIRKLLFYGRTSRNWSTNTYHVFYKSLSVFLQWCKSEGHIDSIPMTSIEKPSIEKKLPKKITRQDALRLLELLLNHPSWSPFLRYRNHALFSVLLFTGIRRSELLHLKIEDVDLRNQTLIVRKGKGSKDRIIPISDTLAHSLKRYLLIREQSDTKLQAVFISSTVNSPLTDTGLRYLLGVVLRLSGLTFTIHTLRHSFATLMLEGGCDLFSLSKMLGHNDLKTTSIYLSASTEHLRNQVSKHPLETIV